MNQQFEKNDRALVRGFVLVDIVTVVTCLLGVVFGVATIVIGARAGNASLIVLGAVSMVVVIPLSALVFWAFMRVFLHFCCDVKLIRNKLYNKDNVYLAAFTETAETSERDCCEDASEAAQPNAAMPVAESSVFANISKLKELKALWDEGILTQEEFEWEKQRLLNKNAEIS